MSDDAPTPTPDTTGEPPQVSWQELALRELQQQRDALEAEISSLSSRRDQLQQEITSSFAGQSDSIARRVKGFQDYLVGALQDLAVAAEQMELVVQPLVVQPSPLDQAAAARCPRLCHAPASDDRHRRASARARPPTGHRAPAWRRGARRPPNWQCR